MTSDVIAKVEAPRCAVQLLARLDKAVSDLADECPDGPYLLEALLQDVGLCPSIGGGVQPAGDDAVGELAERLAEARDAARVVMICPVSTRDFAVERLSSALAGARAVLSRRVEAAAASGSTSSLFADRCKTCAFA